LIVVYPTGRALPNRPNVAERALVPFQHPASRIEMNAPARSGWNALRKSAGMSGPQEAFPPVKLVRAGQAGNLAAGVKVSVHRC
jgi:hypothetical protein